MRILYALTILLLAPLAARAQAPALHGIQFVNPGIYRASTVEQHVVPDSVLGRQHTVANVMLEKKTTDIPGIVGVRFGFYFVVVGQPAGQIVKLRLVIRFPPAGLTDPETKLTHPAERTNIFAWTNELQYQEYLFEEWWEVVPGIWNFELWQGDHKLGEQSFKVFLPGTVMR